MRRRGPAAWRAASGRCAPPGTARPKTCSRPGSRSCSTRRSARSCRGRRCMSGCATARATILFNHLGLGEDEMKMVLRPDCADLPYFLRAYFAFKMGLPFGFSKCTRGGGGRAPTCSAVVQHPERRARARRADAIAAAGHRRRRAGRVLVERSRRRRAPHRAPSLAAAFGRVRRGDRRQRPFRLRREPRWPTTTPTTTRCRSARTRCGRAPSTPIRTATS